MNSYSSRLNVWQLPDVLCIHIQRMAWLNNGMPTKRLDYVSFPEYLDVSEFLYRHQKGSCSEGVGVKALMRNLVGGNNVNPER